MQVIILKDKIWRIVNTNTWAFKEAEKIIPFPDCPKSIGSLPYSNRELIDIENWYQDKIEELNEKLKRYKTDIGTVRKKFKEVNIHT